MAVLKVVTEIEYIVNLQRRKHVEKDLQHQFWIDFRLNAIELKTIASALNDEILSNLVGELLNTQLVLVDEMELSDLKATSTVRDRMEHYKGKLTLILIRIHELNVSVDVS
jgi:hypothetical protein